MKACKCGSYAINHHCHGRDGSDDALCDVCYWRKRAEQPAQQEPVAWMTKDGEIYKHECWPEYEARPLVFGDTSPPAQRTWVGLTDEEIQAIWRSSEHMNEVEVCRAIEAKLRSKNEDRS